jgi:hypothetical protein
MFFEDEDTIVYEEGEEGPALREKPKRKLIAALERVLRPLHFFTDAELMTAAHRETLVLDTECYPNFWLCSFKSIESGRAVSVELSADCDLDRPKLEWILWHFRTVGFNSRRYDLLMISLALKGLPAWELHQVSTAIVKGTERLSDIYDRYNIATPPFNHIDVFDVAPLPDISLKTYSGRLHAKRMQDLPYDPTEPLTREQAHHTRYYCFNDIDNTGLIFNSLSKQLELREALGREYDQDLRSKSDAQIAEAVFGAEIAKITGRYPKKPKIEPGTTFRYKMPSYIRFQTPILQALADAIAQQDFEIDKAGYLLMPPTVGPFVVIGKGNKPIKGPGKGNIKLNLWGKLYSVGMGGLHSNESSIAHISDADTLVIDDDVESYYPRIILNQRLFPPHLTDAFLTVYETFVSRRIAGKKSGDKVVADSLKIVINGSFGKLGSKYSILYSPDLLLQVTLTGQLSLLMLIEMMETAGIPVISANTDGVVKKCPKHLYAVHEAILREWERITDFKTEQTQYRAVYSRDVNNYIAIKKNFDKDRKVWLDEFPVGTKLDKMTKGKGAFGNPWLGGDSVEIMKKNPEFTICVEAVTRFLNDHTPIETTIRECRDITKFVAVRNVKGGAEKNDVYLGKVVRWYYAEGEKTPILSVLYESTVPKSTGGKPLMDLPDEFPADVDYERYIEEASEMLFDIGYAIRPNTQIKFF